MSSRLSRRGMLTILGSSALAATAGLLSACGAAATTTVSASTAATGAAPTSAASMAATTAAGTAAATTAKATSSAAPSASASAVAPPVALGANGILYWQWGSGYVPGFNQLAADFNKAQKNVVVTHEQPAAQPDYWNKIITLQAGGQGPDVFEINNSSYVNWAHNGSLTDVTSYVNQDKTVAAAMKDTYQSMVDWYTYKGKLMGLPWDFSAGTVNYNLDHFKAAGLTPINDLGKQWDWNMMKEYATKLTQSNGPTTTRGGMWVHNSTENGWYSFCAANGARFFNATLDQCTIASAEAIAGLDFLLGMIKTGISATPAFQSAANKAVPSGGTPFTDGATSMDLEGDWNYTTYEKVKGFTNWDAGIFPYSPTSGKTINTSNLRGIVLNTVSKKKDLAWQWMSYLKSNAVQDQIPLLFGEIPSTKTSAETNYLDTAKGGPPPGRKFLGPDLDATVPLPASDLLNSSDLGNAYSPIMTKAFALQVTAADALNQVQQAVNGLLAAAKH
ncbi:MAG TPA: sugar ABC transporter substrate-binding protein [Chloroflexota bacterium]|nr:sugar ABC transporter substrate-binding protein [Chloroflexota bacterium]